MQAPEGHKLGFWQKRYPSSSVFHNNIKTECASHWMPRARSAGKFSTSSSLMDLTPRHPVLTGWHHRHSISILLSGNLKWLATDLADWPVELLVDYPLQTSRNHQHENFFSLSEWCFVKKMMFNFALSSAVFCNAQLAQIGDETCPKRWTSILDSHGSLSITPLGHHGKQRHLLSSVVLVLDRKLSWCEP